MPQTEVTPSSQEDGEESSTPTPDDSAPTPAGPAPCEDTVAGLEEKSEQDLITMLVDLVWNALILWHVIDVV